jgi:hypothetical protein
MEGENKAEGNIDHVGHSMTLLYVDVLLGCRCQWESDYGCIKLKKNLNCHEKFVCKFRGLTYMYINLYCEDCY